MGTAYTPGLTVSEDIIVRRTRRLPIKGEVLVKQGDKVEPHTAVARAMLPGALQTIKLAEKLGVEAREIAGFFTLKPGDPIEKGQMVAQTKGFFGMGKSTVNSEYSGVVESVSEITGNVLVREPSIPVEINAYIQGTIFEVIEREGAVVETRGAMVQGIFGVGGERTGTMRIAVADGERMLDADDVRSDDAGKILVGGSGMSESAIAKAAEVGASGIIAGGIRDVDLIKFLGYDIGVAITGQENIPLTLMVTEGFGHLNMAKRTFDLMKSLEGRTASINGATQIRAGVIRPEIIVPMEHGSEAPRAEKKGLELGKGTSIRIIREPYFGMLGTVTELPAQLQVVESGTEVRVLKARLDGGEEVCVPRANVEIIAT